MLVAVDGSPLSTAAFLRQGSAPLTGPADDDEDEYVDESDIEEIEVLECNWVAVQVYRDCEWTALLGFGDLYFFDISSREILAALHIHRVPRDRWSDTRRRIRIMVGAARPLLNAPKAKPQ